MKSAVQAVLGLTLLAACAEGLILTQIHLDPVKLFALMESGALLIGLFVAFTQAGFVKSLREWTQASAPAAAGLAGLLVVPYLILALGTGTFSALALGKLFAYIAIPTLLLWPDRVRHRTNFNLRDALATVALAVPVAAGWLKGIWNWPQDLYIFRPIFCVILASYVFTVLRKTEGVGFKIIWRWRDVTTALLNLLAFSILAIPLGLALGFLHPHRAAEMTGVLQGNWPALNFLLLFLGIYLTVALPEELLFRGILQNILSRTFKNDPRGIRALLTASLTFGLAHLHHRPVPNWRYAILATLAGLFYGNVYKSRQRLCASALIHALVDTIWHFWL